MAAAAATVVVPVGLSFTLDQQARSRSTTNAAVSAPASHSLAVPPAASIGGPAAVLVVPTEPYRFGLEEVPDAAKLVFVGTLLVGAAAAVRKAA